MELRPKYFENMEVPPDTLSQCWLNVRAVSLAFFYLETSIVEQIALSLEKSHNAGNLKKTH